MACAKMTLFKAIGIGYFVLASYHEPPFVWISIRSFMVAYFFFIVGYYFKPVYGWSNTLVYVKDKAEQYILLYFVYITAFALLRTMVHLLFRTSIMGPYPTLFNFFIEPLLEQRTYPLSGSTWFYPQLFFVCVLTQTIYYNRSGSVYIDVSYLLGALLAFAVGIHALNSTHTLHILYVRIVFSVLFTLLGYIYRQYVESQRDRALFTASYCFVAVSLLCYIVQFYPDVRYVHVKADFHQHPFWVPVAIACLVIYLHLFVCEALQHVLSENDLLQTIAKESYHIMFLHGPTFTFINIVVFRYVWNQDDDRVLNVSYRYQPALTWPIYFGAGIQLPVLFIRCARVLRAKWSSVRSPLPAGAILKT